MKVHLCVCSWLCAHVEGGAPCISCSNAFIPIASLNVDCVVCLWLIRKPQVERPYSEKMPLCEGGRSILVEEREREREGGRERERERED